MMMTAFLNPFVVAEYISQLLMFTKAASLDLGSLMCCLTMTKLFQGQG